MNTTVDSTDTDEVKDGYVGLTVVGIISVFLFCWFVPSIGLLLGVSILAAAAVSLIVLALTFIFAAVETVFAGDRVRAEAPQQTVRIKRRPLGA